MNSAECGVRVIDLDGAHRDLQARPALCSRRPRRACTPSASTTSACTASPRLPFQFQLGRVTVTVSVHSASCSPQSLHAVAILSPVLGIGFNVSRERVLGVTFAPGSDIPQCRHPRRREACSRISGRGSDSVCALGLRDDVNLVAAFLGEAGWGFQTVTGGVGVFKLALEKHIARLSRQRREYFSGAGDEPVQLKREECAGSRATTIFSRQTNVGQKSLETFLANRRVDAAILL